MTKQTVLNPGYSAAGPVASGVSTPSKSDKHPYILAIVILAVLMVAGVTFGVIGMILGTQQNKNSAEVAPSQSADASLETVELVDDKGEVTELVVRNRNNEAGDEKDVRHIVSVVREQVERMVQDEAGTTISILNTYDEVFPIYRPDGWSVAIDLDQSYGLFVTSLNADDRAQQRIMSDEMVGTIDEALRKYGFSEYTDVSLMSGREYIDDDGVICLLRDHTYPLSFGCGHTSWIDADVAALVRQVVGQSGYDGGYLYAREADIIDSTYAPYQRLEARLMGATGLFYRASANDPWQFFTGVQVVLGCEQFDTDDLRRAFAGTVCYDSATGRESTVQP